MGKNWYTSKTLWVNFLAFLFVLLQVTGTISEPVSPETQAVILTIINFILRLITGEEIIWKANK